MLIACIVFLLRNLESRRSRRTRNLS